MTNRKLEATFHPGDEPAVPNEGPLSVGAAVGEATPDLQRYAHMQIVGARMARDEPQLQSFVANVMLHRPTPGFERVDDEHAVAVSFGKMVHDHGPERECADDDTCTVWPCTDDDPDATVAMIRVEVNVRKVECTAEPTRDGWCPECSTAGGPVYHA